jgi:predicted helicase
MIAAYRRTLALATEDEREDVEDLIAVSDPDIKWTRQVKAALSRRKAVQFEIENIREAQYRPFTKTLLYFDDFWNEEQYQLRHIFPVRKNELENRVIVASAIGYRAPYSTLLVGRIPELHLCASTDGFQCFPFYTYDDDGSNRRENITDWALEEFRRHYSDAKITKWDIFHYSYAVLHSPEYRERYAANLKRELPRIPLAPDFWAFAKPGQRLAELHVNYEKQPEYPLERIENPNAKLNFRVEKMRLGKDKASLVYNNFLTLSGIPPETYEYRLGNRSALEWVIDQYQLSTDKRSGITNDPNREDDPEYIVRLIGQVTYVSLETVKIVRCLPKLNSAKSEAKNA